jgi:hypothetical protein
MSEAQPDTNRSEKEREKSYIHNASKKWIILFSGTTGLFMFWFGYLALTNNRGLIVNGAILGPNGATIFYYGATVFFGWSFLMFVAIAIQRVVNPHSLVLRTDGINFCRGWLKPKPTFVPFATIKTISHQQNVTTGIRRLILKAGNEVFIVDESFLASRQNYDEILGKINSALNIKNNATPTPPKPPESPKPPPDDDSRYMPKS